MCNLYSLELWAEVVNISLCLVMADLNVISSHLYK